MKFQYPSLIWALVRQNIEAIYQLFITTQKSSNFECNILV